MSIYKRVTFLRSIVNNINDNYFYSDHDDGGVGLLFLSLIEYPCGVVVSFLNTVIWDDEKDDLTDENGQFIDITKLLLERINQYKNSIEHLLKMNGFENE